MEIKVRIKTIKGKARKVEGRVRNAMLGGGVRRWKKLRAYFNDEDNMILWELEDNPRRIMKVMKNIGNYDAIMQRVFSQKIIRKRVKPEQLEELEELLGNQTSCEVIKEATAQELIDGKTFWERLKERFKGKKEDK